MGTTNSKGSKQYKIKHQKFQYAKIINQDQLEIELRTSLDEYNSWKANLKKINSFNKQNILFPLNYNFVEEGWCSQNTGIVKIIYDNYQFVFEEELQNRITLQRHLSEEEMWYLLYTLTSTAKDFSFLNRKVGDIRPHNIFVSEAGQIKLSVCFSWPNETSNFEKTLNDRQITYLSPQEFQMCKNNKIDAIINPITAESFSIGLTMLHAGLLFNFSSIYNMQKMQINKKILEQKFHDWMNLQYFDQNNNKTSYSSSLKQIVKNLCILNPQKRELSTQIFSILQPHKQLILNIQPFQLNYKTTVFNQPHGNGYIYPLQKSRGLPVYNYTEISKNVFTSQTPYSIAPNLDWSTRMFSQVPSNKVNNTNFHHQLFDKYANTAHSGSKGQPLSIRMTHTINQRQSFENRPNIDFNYSVQPGSIRVRPFPTYHDENTQNVIRPFNVPVGQLEGHIEKKVESKDYIHYSQQPIQTKQTKITKVQTWKSSFEDPSQFLKKIDQQLQKSKSMFPS